MNTQQNAIISCDNCDQMFEVELWTEITAGADQNLDNKIFNEELNLFECEACGNVGYALYPIKMDFRWILGTLLLTLYKSEKKVKPSLSTKLSLAM